MTSSNPIIDIVNKLTLDAQIFYSKGNTYRQYAELDGCLINLMLAANSLYQAIDILAKNDVLVTTEKPIHALKQKEDTYLHVSQCRSPREVCKQDLEGILTTILNEIRPLQEQLRKKKSNGAQKDKDNENCDLVQEENLELDMHCKDFSDVVGCQDAKDTITECFINTFEYPNLFKNRTRAILFYGPPGTGKTLMVKAAINELKKKKDLNINIHFFAPLAAQLKGKYVGDTEKKIKAYFECASAAACNDEIKTKTIGKDFQRNLSILFLDEIEALAGSRGAEGTGEGMTSSVNTLLQMMDGVASVPNLIVIGATNYPWKLDGAILRRFPTRIFIDLPKKNDIVKLIFKEYAKFVKIDDNETIGIYNQVTQRFEKNEKTGFLLLRKGKKKEDDIEYDDNESIGLKNDEKWIDNIDEYCSTLHEKKEIETGNLPYSKKTDKQSNCIDMLEKRDSENEIIKRKNIYSQILDKNTYNTLFNDEFILYLSYGFSFAAVQELSNCKDDEEYIKKKRDFVVKKIVQDTYILAAKMEDNLFSNSDITTFFQDKYFSILSNESLYKEKKRYVLNLAKSNITFHVDSRSLDIFSPKFAALKSLQVDNDKYGNLLLKKKDKETAKYVKYTEILYYNMMQLEDSPTFEGYWVKEDEWATQEEVKTTYAEIVKQQVTPGKVAGFGAAAGVGIYFGALGVIGATLASWAVIPIGAAAVGMGAAVGFNVAKVPGKCETLTADEKCSERVDCKLKDKKCSSRLVALPKECLRTRDKESSNFNIIAKLNGKDIFITTSLMYFCSLEVKAQHRLNEIERNVKMFKTDGMNTTYFQQIKTLTISDTHVLGQINNDKVNEVAKKLDVELKNQTGWMASIGKFFWGIPGSFSGGWSWARRYLFGVGKGNELLNIDKNLMIEQERIAKLLQQQRENILYKTLAEESNDDMVKLLMGMNNLSKIFFIIDKQEPEPKVKPEVKPEDKPQVKPEGKPQVKLEGKPQVKQEGKPQVKLEGNPKVLNGGMPPKKPAEPNISIEVHTQYVSPKSYCLDVNQLIDTIIARLKTQSDKTHRVPYTMVYLNPIEFAYFDAMFKKINCDNFLENEQQRNDWTNNITMLHTNFRINRIIIKAIQKTLTECNDFDTFKSLLLKSILEELEKVEYTLIPTCAPKIPVDSKPKAGAPTQNFGYVSIREGDPVDSEILILKGHTKNNGIFNLNKSIILGDNLSACEILDGHDLKTTNVIYSFVNKQTEFETFEQFITPLKTTLATIMKEDSFWTEDCSCDPCESLDLEEITADHVNDSTNINPKLFRTFQINPTYAMKRLLNPDQLQDFFYSSTKKEDYAQMLYYQRTRIDPNTKERRKKAYNEAARQFSWAQDLSEE